VTQPSFRTAPRGIKLKADARYQVSGIRKKGSLQPSAISFQEEKQSSVVRKESYQPSAISNQLSAKIDQRSAISFQKKTVIGRQF